MSKAEEIHYKAVMAADNQEPPKDYDISAHSDHFNGFVEGYVEGYHQAEKDLELTWEDMQNIRNIITEMMVESYTRNSSWPTHEEFSKETLKRFNKLKGK
jgi:hypothetical protein